MATQSHHAPPLLMVAVWVSVVVMQHRRCVRCFEQPTAGVESRPETTAPVAEQCSVGGGAGACAGADASPSAGAYAGASAGSGTGAVAPPACAVQLFEATGIVPVTPVSSSALASASGGADRIAVSGGGASVYAPANAADSGAGAPATPASDVDDAGAPGEGLSVARKRPERRTGSDTAESSRATRSRTAGKAAADAEQASASAAAAAELDDDLVVLSRETGAEVQVRTWPRARDRLLCEPRASRVSRRRLSQKAHALIFGELRKALQLHLHTQPGDGRCMYASLLDAISRSPRPPTSAYEVNDLPRIAANIASEWAKGALSGVVTPALDTQRKFLHIFSPEDQSEEVVRAKLQRRARPTGDPVTWGGEWSCMCLAYYFRCHLVVVVHSTESRVTEVQVIDSTNYTDKAPFPPDGQQYAGRRTVATVDEVYALLDKSCSSEQKAPGRRVYFLRHLRGCHYDAYSVRKEWVVDPQRAASGTKVMGDDHANGQPPAAPEQPPAGTTEQ